MLLRRVRSAPSCWPITTYWWISGTTNSQSADGCCRGCPGWCCRCLVVARSGVDVTFDESEPFGNANLIVHHGLADIIHQIVKLLCILCVAQELRNVLLSFHSIQSSTDAFKLPSDPCSSTPALDIREGELTLLVSFSYFSP